MKLSLTTLQSSYLSHRRGSDWVALAVSLTLACASALADGWKQHTTTGPSPSARSTPAVGAVGAQVYVFGGVFDSFIAGTDTFYNDLYRFNTKSDHWTQLTPTGAVPPALSLIHI